MRNLRWRAAVAAAVLAAGLSGGGCAALTHRTVEFRDGDGNLTGSVVQSPSVLDTAEQGAGIFSLVQAGRFFGELAGALR